MIDVDSLSEDECRSVLKMMGWTPHQENLMPYKSYKYELQNMLDLRATIQEIRRLQNGDHN